MVEFALTLAPALMIMLVTIQFAIVGAAASGATQLAHAGARYAAVNRTSVESDISTYMKSVASPAINENRGGDLSITVCTPAGNTCPHSTTSRTFGSLVQVSVVYDLSSNLFLPNPFLGIGFPTSLSGIQSTMMNE